MTQKNYTTVDLLLLQNVINFFRFRLKSIAFRDPNWSSSNRKWICSEAQWQFRSEAHILLRVFCAFAVMFNSMCYLKVCQLSLSTFNRDKSLSKVFFTCSTISLCVCMSVSVFISLSSLAFIYSKLFVCVFVFLLVASDLFLCCCLFSVSLRKHQKGTTKDKAVLLKSRLLIRSLIIFSDHRCEKRIILTNLRKKMCDFCLFICLENKAMRESKLRYMFEKFHFVLSESFVIATWLKRPLTESHFGLLREMVSSEKKNYSGLNKHVQLFVPLGGCCYAIRVSVCVH